MGCHVFRARPRVVIAQEGFAAQAFFTRLAHDPDWYLGVGADEILKDDTATIARIREDDSPLVIKRYNTRSTTHLCRNALRKTRARKCWDNTCILTAVGIQTARPIAVVERRLGPFAIGSYYVSEFVEGERCQEYFTTCEDRATMATVATSIARMFHRLRKNQIRHGDMKAKNIIIRHGQPVLIDLDGLRRYRTEWIFRRVRTKDAERFIRAWDRWPPLADLFRQVFEQEGLLR